jgi:O-antigen/teichoic acid export membrane protein
MNQESATLWAKLRGRIATASKRGGRNAIFYTLTSLLSRAAVLVLAPLYTRRLAPSDYGDLALAQTLVSTIPTFASLGLLSALSRFFFEGANATEGIQRAGGVARWIAVVAVGSAVVFQLLLFALPLPTVGLLQLHELSCIVWGATGALMLGVPMVVLRSAQRAVPASILQLIDFAVSLGTAIVLVAVLGRGIRGALEATALAGVVSSLVSIVFILRFMRGPLDVSVLRRALAFSLPYVPHFASNQLLLISDRWFLKLFGFDHELGVYSLASQLAAPVTIIIVAWNEAVSPRVGEEFRERGIAALKDAEKSVVKGYFFLALSVSGLLLLASPLALLVFGSNYSAALWFLPGLCLVMIIEAFYFPYSNYLFFMNQTSLIPKITILAAVANVMSNLLLIPLLGVPGAIVSRALGGGVRSAVSAYSARAKMAHEQS